MLSINSKPCCIWCGKDYKTKINLEKHVILCELIHKSNSKKKSVSCDDISEDLPSPKKMYQMLLELGYKYSKLEEKMEQVNKFVVKNKKKINVIEWLNSNATPNLVFDKLIDIINVIDSDVEYLMNNSFLDTMNLVLSRFLYHLESGESIFTPLFAFSQKVNIFYAFVQSSDKDTSDKENNGVWMELPKDKLCLFLMRVQIKISKAFHEWKKPRANKIRDEDSFAVLCDKTLIKIMANEFKTEATFNKMRGIMYNKMKTDMKAILEYEFEF
jgi:uncharacterized protein YeeX (DUF496 family)